MRSLVFGVDSLRLESDLMDAGITSYEIDDVNRILRIEEADVETVLLIIEDLEYEKANENFTQEEIMVIDDFLTGLL